MELSSTLVLCSYYILYISVSENLILFSIRLQFHLGPGPNLSYTPTSYSILYKNFSFIEIDKVSLRNMNLNKIIFLQKEKE